VEAGAFESYLTQLAQLTRAQCVRVLALLKPAVDQGRTAAVIEEAVAPRLCCPRCQGKQFYRHGTKSGLQRFRCQACGRTFNSLTGTPLARLRHKEKWLDFGDCMLDSRTVRKAAARVQVDKNTSHRWRHRFLMATKTDRPACLKGIAEADETFLLESQKGARNLQRPTRKRGGKASKRGISNEQVCILVARDRSGNTVDFVTGRGPVTVVQLTEHLRPVLSPDTLLVTDANKAYQAFARQQGISHQYVNVSAGEHVRGAVQVQNVNGYHSRFHKWLKRFNGVATRYLTNSLGWLWAIDRERIRSPATLLRAAIGVFNT
jgi:transposase-like protein/IS1 family transposase